MVQRPYYQGLPGWLFKSEKQLCSEDGNDPTHWKTETRDWSHGAGQSQLKQQDAVSCSRETERHSGVTRAKDGNVGDSQLSIASIYSRQPLTNKTSWLATRGLCVQQHQECIGLASPPPSSDSMHLRKDFWRWIMEFFEHPEPSWEISLTWHSSRFFFFNSL